MAWVSPLIGSGVGALWKAQQSTVARIVRHSLVLFSWEALSRLARFATSVYLARALGPRAFGLLAFGQALLAYVALGADWGLGTYGAREIAGAPGSWVRIWLRIGIVRTGTGAVLTATALVTVMFSRWDELTKWVVATSVLSALPIALMPEWVYRGREKMAAAGLLGSSPVLIALIGIILFVRTSADVAIVPFVRLVAVTLVAVAAQVALIASSRARVLKARTNLSTRGHDIAHLLRTGIVFLSTNLAVMAYYNIDVVLLRFMQGDQIVGWYSSAYRVVWVPMAAFSALTTAAFPVLTQQWHSKTETTKVTLRPLVEFSAVAGVVIALVVAVSRHSIISLLYGSAFLPAAAPLGLLAVVVPLEFLTGLMGTSYLARGLERPVLTCVAGSAALNVLANLALIPHFGMMGAASATVVSYTALLVAFVLWFERGPLRRRLQANLTSARE